MVGGRVRRHPWTAVAVLAALVGVAGASAYAVACDDGSGAPAPALVAVERGEVTVEVAATGSLEPAQERSLGFATAGEVATVRVSVGDTVAAGQTLATLDPEAAEDRAESARDAVDRAEDAVDAAEDSADGGAVCAVAYQESMATHSASPSPGRTPSPSPTATATRTPRPTTTPSSPTGGGPTSGGPTAPAQPAPSATQQCAGRSTGGDPILQAQQQLTAAQLSLAQAEDALDGTTLTAPIAGTVLSVGGSVGSQVGAGGTFVTIADVSGIQVSATVPEADAYRLEAGQAATVTLADRPEAPLEATVARVDPQGQSDGTLVTYGVTMSFSTDPGHLLIGQSARVWIVVQKATDVLRVPATAVRGTGGSGSVRVRAADGWLTAREIGVGIRGDAYTEITSGLRAGDEVARAG